MSEGRASSSPVKAADVFGSLAFNDKAQQERLPKPVYRALRATITRGEPLDLSTADAVATALLRLDGVAFGGAPDTDVAALAAQTRALARKIAR